MTCEDPLYILPHSKDVLTHAIQTDTYFLASQSVMDYSLLVGLDKERKELVVGIIGKYQCTNVALDLINIATFMVTHHRPHINIPVLV